MKFPLLFLLFICLASNLPAQVVTGLFSGTLVNDSTKKQQRYELALSEYRGKITGYSYTTFVVNDTFYYGVKRIKGHKKNGTLIIEDDEMIANNFPEAPAKGVRQTNTIQLRNIDTLRQADGTWQTNRTKTYYALHGNVALQRNNDSAQSALIGHLKELNIIAQPHYASQNEIKIKTTPKEVKIKKQPAAAVALPYPQRNKKLLQTFNAASDSLVIAFYDNGVIDGDSISVYINGQPIINNQKLTAAATKKTVHFPSSGRMELVLVAENLGTLPPNTGLIVIKDGDKTYQVSFSADLQTNASIILNRRAP